MSYYDTIKQRTLATLPTTYADCINPQLQDHLRHGIRKLIAAEIPAGQTVTGRTYQDTGDGVNVQEIIQTRPTADVEAEQAAAEIERKNTPVLFDQPIQARIEIPVDPGHYYRLEVDPVTGDTIGVEIESDRLTPEQYAAAHAASLALRADRRATRATAGAAVTAAKGAAAGAGNSIVALRQSVADLAAAVEMLMGGL